MGRTNESRAERDDDIFLIFFETAHFGTKSKK